MASVPQRTLNWLYSVLIRDHYDPRQTYQDPNRTYYDVANVLAKYPSLSPRTEVYTYENGFSALLLQLSGTLPVTYRGSIYKFPVVLWIPNTYPREPPIVYVTPTQDMAVRIGQHVTLEGRVYHHYLAHWAEAWERSTLVDFLSILQDIFAKEPPVKYKQQQPIPQQVQAPPPPPRPGQITGPTGPLQPDVQSQQHRAPPLLPPLPPKEQSHQQPVPPPHPSIGIPMNQQYLPRQSNLAGASPLPPLPTQQHTGFHLGPSYTSESTYQQPQNGTQDSLAPRRQTTPHSQVPPHAAYHQPPPSTQQPHHPPYHSTAKAPPAAQQPAPRPKPTADDLLTSPFELELPSFAPTGPAPPIPPNPEKDALLRAISKVLTENLHANIAQSESAAQSLTSQSHSIHAAISTLQAEIASLTSLNSTLESNTSILQQSLHRADAVIADAQNRVSATAAHPSSSSDPTATATATGLPPIDEILVAPTVVGKQLYDLVADERGIQQAIYALQAALVKGVIGVETWSRHTRSLAREAFLKRALIRKIGKGMGLEEY